MSSSESSEVGSGSSAVEFNSGDVAWIIVCSALVMIMTPGLGLFYGGMTKRKNAISTIMQSIGTLAIVSLQWWFWGYSLAFSPGGGPFYGNLNYFLFLNFNGDNHLTKAHPNAPTIPNFLYGIYQCMFAGITPALIFGSVAGRLRFRTMCVFVILWSTLVYCPVAHWIWSPDGWGYKLGVLDFAGGIVVHATASFAGLAMAIFMRARHGYKDYRWRLHHLVNSSEPFYQKVHKAEYWELGHNVPIIILGTALLWFGWFGFNGGSALAANGQAVIAFINTHFAACAGAITWGLLDLVFEKGKYVSSVAICSGAVAGMACITPAAGFVKPPISIIFGVSGSLCSYVSTKIVKLVVDDSEDTFSVHGFGGSSGVFLTAIFAARDIPADGGGFAITGGWWDRHFIQLAYQLAGFWAAAGWSFVMTLCICLLLEWIPGLGFRVTAQEEEIGLDVSQHGESAYLNQGDEEIEGLGQHEHIVRLIKRLLKKEKRPRNRDRNSEEQNKDWNDLLELYKEGTDKDPDIPKSRKSTEMEEVSRQKRVKPDVENGHMNGDGNGVESSSDEDVGSDDVTASMDESEEETEKEEKKKKKSKK